MTTAELALLTYIQPFLLVGEDVLWLHKQGEVPVQSRIIRITKNAFAALLLFMLFVFCTFGAWHAVNSHGLYSLNVFLMAVSAILTAAGLLIPAWNIRDAFDQDRMIYALTNQRIIIASTQRKQSSQFSLTGYQSIDRTDHSDGSSTLRVHMVVPDEFDDPQWLEFNHIKDAETLERLLIPFLSPPNQKAL